MRVRQTTSAKFIDVRPAVSERARGLIPNMSTAPRTTLTLPADILAGLDQAAEAERRSRSNMASIAIEQYLAQRNSTSGASRLADLERLAHSNVGVNMPDDTDPRPTDVGSQGNVGAPAFGGPFGKSTVDEKVLAQNAGRQTQISKDSHNANKQHLADHLARTGGKPWGEK